MPGDIIKTIVSLPRGKANGLFMDSQDIFIRLAKQNNASNNKAIRHLFQHIFNGNVHPCMEPYFNNTYLFCLHKDENDPDKIRPIGIPTALRRIITSHTARMYRRKFARHLMPFNFAIGIENGMDFVVKASQLAIEKYITLPQLHGLAPSRCFVSLDLTNMFNSVSREKLFQIIRRKYPELLPLVNMLYKNDGTVFFRMHDGTWESRPMQEGVNQGCPLSSTLAALVLNEVLEPLYASLQQRARNRATSNPPNLGDDNAGGISHPMAYVDDTNGAIYHEDVLFFLTEFRRLGKPLGLNLNNKTRIMTSTNGTSSLPQIEATYGKPTADSIRTAIDEFSYDTTKNPDGSITKTRIEETNGLRLLGQPVGSLSFAKSFIDKQVTIAEENATKLLQKVPDHQTALKLFSMCTLHKTPHLLGSEVLYRFQESAYERWDDWSGPLACRIDTMVNSFISRLAQRDNIPTFSLLIAYISIAQGGLGLMDPFTRAIPDFVLTMSHATRYADRGIQLSRSEASIKLPPTLCQLFSTQHNPQSAILGRFYRLLPDIATIAAPKTCNDPLDYVLYQLRQTNT